MSYPRLAYALSLRSDNVEESHADSHWQTVQMVRKEAQEQRPVVPLCQLLDCNQDQLHQVDLYRGLVGQLLPPWTIG